MHGSEAIFAGRQSGKPCAKSNSLPVSHLQFTVANSMFVPRMMHGSAPLLLSIGQFSASCPRSKTMAVSLSRCFSRYCLRLHSSDLSGAKGQRNQDVCKKKEAMRNADQSNNFANGCID